jgi:hypothetical protein
VIRRRGALRPARPRRRPACLSVSQSVTERAALELRALATAPEKEAEAEAAGGARAAASLPGEDRAAAAVSARPHPGVSRGRKPAGRGAVRRSHLHFPGAWPRHPGAVRAAAAWGGVVARLSPAGPRGARWGGWRSAGPGLHPAPPGGRSKGDNEMWGRLGGCGWGAGRPGPREGRGCPPPSCKNQ